MERAIPAVPAPRDEPLVKSPGREPGAVLIHRSVARLSISTSCGGPSLTFYLAKGTQHNPLNC